MPVGEMLARMSSAEITEWMAFFQLEDEAGKPKKPGSTPAELRAMFAHRVIKKPQE